MVEDLKRFFHRLIKRVDGLHAIIITDRDGVPLLKVSDENTPEMAMRPLFLATFGMTTEQASKLGLNYNRTIISIYGSYQVISLNKLPLIVTMIADVDGNTGMMLSLEDDMADALETLRSVVDNTWETSAS